jgi:hypothetical protein
VTPNLQPELLSQVKPGKQIGVQLLQVPSLDLGSDAPRSLIMMEQEQALKLVAIADASALLNALVRAQTSRTSVNSL